MFPEVGTVIMARLKSMVGVEGCGEAQCESLVLITEEVGEGSRCGGVGSMWLGEVTVLNLLNNTFNSLALFRHPSP